MKKNLFIIAILTVVLAVGFIIATPSPAEAMSTACERFASNVVVGSNGSVRDAIACALSDPWGFFDLIT
ncbi:MAG: hypothetical protein AAB424_03135 [Patescibacteria group bacterium]